MIDAKSPFTARHSERVAEIAVGIGARARLRAPTRRRDLRRAGLLHDVGKLAISNRILDKPGKLTDDGVREDQGSTRRYSLEILERAPCFAPIAALAANHHERIDGTGYPRGLGDDALDMPMRVLAVADVYEALTADRPYRGRCRWRRRSRSIASDVPGRLDRARRALERYLGASRAAARSPRRAPASAGARA